MKTEVKTKSTKYNNSSPSEDLTANAFNENFTEEPERLVEEEYGPHDQEYDQGEDGIGSSELRFSIPHMTEENAKQIISDIPTDKSCGSDGITIRFIKLFQISLIFNLITIINQSIDTSKFPIAWKLAFQIW